MGNERKAAAGKSIAPKKQLPPKPLAVARNPTAPKKQLPPKPLACVPGSPSNSPHLAPDDVAMLLRSQDKPFLLDVRERDEFAGGHVAGSVNIPLGTVVAGVLDGRLPRERVIIVICGHGSRAGRAASELSSRGFVTAVLAGGLEAWRRRKRGRGAQLAFIS